MSEEQTDSALQIATICTLVSVGLCVLAGLYRSCRNKPKMKPSRSNDDLTSILDNAIPSYRVNSDVV